MEVKLFKRNGINVCYNPLTMDFYLLDKETSLVLDKIQNRARLSGKEKIKAKEIEEILKAPERKSIASYSRETRIEEYLKMLSRLTLVVTNACNMQCKYCYESMNHVKHKFNFNSILSMKPDIAKKALDDYISVYKNIRTIMFFGGEPTLEMSLIDDVCAYVVEKHANGTLKELPNFGIITNGTILSEHILNIF